MFGGYGYVSASVEMPPARMEGFFSDVSRIAADLRDHEITADELNRAKNPALQELERSRNTNEYWLSVLSGAQADPRRLDAVRSVVGGISRVTPADVRRTAQEFLRDDRAWRLIVRPGAPPTAQAASAGH